MFCASCGSPILSGLAPDLVPPSPTSYEHLGLVTAIPVVVRASQFETPVASCGAPTGLDSDDPR